MEKQTEIGWLQIRQMNWKESNRWWEQIQRVFLYLILTRVLQWSFDGKFTVSLSEVQISLFVIDFLFVHNIQRLLNNCLVMTVGFDPFNSFIVINLLDTKPFERSQHIRAGVSTCFRWWTLIYLKFDVKHRRLLFLRS